MWKINFPCAQCCVFDILELFTQVCDISQGQRVLYWSSMSQVIQTLQDNIVNLKTLWHDWLHMTYHTMVSLQTWQWNTTEWICIQQGWRGMGMLYINNLSCPSLFDDMTKWVDCCVTQQIGRELQITLATGPTIFKRLMSESGRRAILQQWFGKKDNVRIT